MIRRTLALAGAAALAAGFTGLAGPAAADSGITQAGAVFINEVGAELDPNSSNHDVEHGFIELINRDTAPVDVSGWTVIGCATSGSFNIVIDSDTSIPANGTFLVGELEFDDLSGTVPDQRFEAGEVLEQTAGGARLEDPNGSQPDNEVMWGPDNSVACASTNAGVLPTDDESIHYDPATDTYFLDAPTPQPL
ncbi:MAG: hypothetical protein GEV12_06775 [Micromonosporaceae bacterium]|nr:hypothetical protein [Micromonosporaceae bacterium]